MLHLSILLTSLMALTTTINATPMKSPRWDHRVQGCDLSQVHLTDLPSGQTNVTVDSNATPLFVTLGVGVQNYTCQNGAYVSIGAVAQLFDISCLAGTDIFESIQDFAVDSYTGSTDVKLNFDGHDIYPIIFHDFISFGSGIAPRFNLVETGQFTTLKKTGSITSPQGKENVDWLELSEVDGDLAKWVYRTDTVRGQPPASCDNGSPTISINYAAKYWFFNSN